MKQGWIKFSWKHFGADVRATREAKGYGLRECANKLNLDPPQWIHIERGRPTATPYFVFLCEWMGKNPAIYAIEHPMIDSPPTIAVSARKQNRK